MDSTSRQTDEEGDPLFSSEDATNSNGSPNESASNNLSSNWNDIFGVGEEVAQEANIGQKMGEEEQRLRDDKIQWDGHSSSAEATARATRTNITLKDQIEKIHRAKGLIPDSSKEGNTPKPQNQVVPLPPQPMCAPIPKIPPSAPQVVGIMPVHSPPPPAMIIEPQPFFMAPQPPQVMNNPFGAIPGPPGESGEPAAKRMCGKESLSPEAEFLASEINLARTQVLAAGAIPQFSANDENDKTTSSIAQGSPPDFTNLIEDVVLMIASYLNASDLISFSSCCQNVHLICERDEKIWRKVLQREKNEFAPDFVDLAEATIETQTQFATTNVKKLAVLLLKQTKRNWMSAEPKPFALDCNKYNRIYEDWGSFKFDNHSSFYLPTSVEWIRPNGGSATLKFNLWDVRFDKIFSSFEKTLENVDGGDQFEFHLFNDFLLLIHERIEDDGCKEEVTRFKIELEGSELNKVWKTQVKAIKDYFRCERLAFENIFAVPFMDACGKKKPTVYRMEVFSCADGSKLSSIKLKAKFDQIRFEIAQSDGGWFVFYVEPLLIAFNYETNTKRVFGPKDADGFARVLSQMVLKSGKALLCYDHGVIELIDVSSGSIIWSWYKSGLVRCVSFFFDPATDEVMVSNSRNYGLIIQALTDTAPTQTPVKHTVCHPFASFPSPTWMLGSLLVLVRNSITGEKHLQLVNRKINWRSEEGIFPSDVEIEKVSPFFVAVRCNNKEQQVAQLQVFKFVNLNNNGHNADDDSPGLEKSVPSTSTCKHQK